MIFLVFVFLIFVYNIKFKIIFLFVCIIEKKIIKKMINVCYLMERLSFWLLVLEVRVFDVIDFIFFNICVFILDIV